VYNYGSSQGELITLSVLKRSLTLHHCRYRAANVSPFHPLSNDGMSPDLPISTPGPPQPQIMNERRHSTSNRCPGKLGCCISGYAAELSHRGLSKDERHGAREEGKSGATGLRRFRRTAGQILRSLEMILGRRTDRPCRSDAIWLLWTQRHRIVEVPVRRVPSVEEEKKRDGSEE
jgi:hypothetical protein